MSTPTDIYHKWLQENERDRWESKARSLLRRYHGNADDAVVRLSEELDDELGTSMPDDIPEPWLSLLDAAMDQINTLDIAGDFIYAVEPSYRTYKEEP